MMARRIVLILLAPFMIEIAIGCCDCDDYYPLVTRQYTNQHIQLDNLDNRGNAPVVSTSGSVLKEAYGVRVHLYRDLLARSGAPRAGFITPAQAFSCDCSRDAKVSPKDSITAIHIVTRYDFDASHPAGSDISDLFRVHTEVFPNQDLVTLDAYIRYPDLLYKSDAYDAVEAFIAALAFDILLMEAPAAGGLHRFNIQLALSDGRILEQETAEIELL